MQQYLKKSPQYVGIFHTEHIFRIFYYLDEYSPIIAWKILYEMTKMVIPQELDKFNPTYINIVFKLLQDDIHLGPGICSKTNNSGRFKYCCGIYQFIHSKIESQHKKYNSKSFFIGDDLKKDMDIALQTLINDEMI